VTAPEPGSQPGARARAAPEPLATGLPAPARRLLKLAVAALARREHGRAELERKLLRRLEQQADGASADDPGPDGARPAHVAAVLDLLQARGYLCDTRMAQSLARTRAPRYGRRRIALELERRGVGAESIAAVLPSQSEEAATALALWQRKFGALPASAAERARQGRFLAARGFGSDVIARILSGRNGPEHFPADE